MAQRRMIRHPLQYPRDTVFFDRETFQKPPTKQIFAKPGCGWVSVYPVYLDKSKTRPEGRKVALDSACEIISASHIFEACKRLNLARVLEVSCLSFRFISLLRKLNVPTRYIQPRAQHPRDWGRWGRVRTQIKTAEGEYCNPTIKTRKDLFAKLCEEVPKIKMPERKDATSAAKKKKKKKKKR